MLIIGELINSTREEVKVALQKKNESIIRRLARKQVEAGAKILDINTAISGGKQEIDDMEWTIGVIYDEVGQDIRLSIDSPNPDTIVRGLELSRARPLVNSINNKSPKKEKLVSLLKEYEADIIGLAMGGSGMPKTSDDRLDEAGWLIGSMQDAGIPLERLYIDPLVMTIGSNQDQALAVIKTVRVIKERWGKQGVKTSVGLSNVSFGLPQRSIINRAFLVMLLEAGLDAAIIDPTDQRLLDLLSASEALLNTDAYCLNYIKRMRVRIK